MGAVGGAGGRPQGGDSYAILNDCRDIDRGIDSVLGNIDRIKYLQQRTLDDPDGSRENKSSRDLRALNDDTQALTSSLKDRIQKIKGRPEAGETSNRGQVNRVQRKLQEAIQDKQKVDADFRRKLQEQNERQYKIVRPDASEAEVKEACADPAGMQVFSQAVGGPHQIRHCAVNLADVYSLAAAKRPPRPVAVGAPRRARAPRGHPEDRAGFH